ncbi:hypothetical protein MMC12_006038 [Toensbergia leucococca]|nr:hypothetical protein [Toensbergia leucococca]
MVSKKLPSYADVVIVGNGPSALILSFILHGNIPYYNHETPHPDPILHQKLLKSPCLLDVDVADLTAHFAASRLSYSTQALPINVLLDTLLRPLADTEPGNCQSRVIWRQEPEKGLSHLVLGNSQQAGGQWADNPIAASWDIGTLSYAEMLSLPAYGFLEHCRSARGKNPSECYRPTRREVADYLAVYPEIVGISDTLYTSIDVEGVARSINGFHVRSPNIACKYLILASGTFSHLIPPRLLLQPIAELPRSPEMGAAPLLVVGSGFTAADIIISTPPCRKIIHIFKWDPEMHPSPLRACHPHAYPEYAGVYRRMKLAAMRTLGKNAAFTPLKLRKTNPFFAERDWDSVYEGLPNTFIKEVSIRNGTATVTLEGSDRETFRREVSHLEYVVGRRGSLEYLENKLVAEILGSASPYPVKADSISGQTLRSKVENSLEVAPNVFVTGSLTGDSLVRFAFGGCVLTASELIKRREHTSRPEEDVKSQSVLLRQSMKQESRTIDDSGYALTNGHTNLGIDRKVRSPSFDLELSACELWRDSGWWTGGCALL